MFKRFLFIPLLFLVVACGPCKNPKYQIGDRVTVDGIEGILTGNEQSGGCVYYFRYKNDRGELLSISVKEFEINV